MIPQRLGVIVRDRRPYVQSGSKSPQFVGLQRSLVGIPYGVHTASGLPLAEDLSSLISDTLRRNGTEALSLTKGTDMSDDDVSKALMSSAIQRAYLIELKEWKSDSMARVAFVYDVDINVIDQSGNSLAKKSEKGSDALGVKEFNVGVARVLERLLADPGVVRAASGHSTLTLISEATKPVYGRAHLEPIKTTPMKTTEDSGKKATCSVAQVLKMKELGLNDSQITSACQ